MKDEDQDDSRLFERAIRSQRDASATFFAEFGFDASRSMAMIESEKSLRARIRKAMEAGVNESRLFRLDEEAAPYVERAKRMLDAGRVAAIDGTNALAKLDFMNTTQYACAVAWITSRARGEPYISITETSSAYVDPEAVRAASPSDLIEICRQLDESRQAESWPTTFREYQERTIAVSAEGVQVVLLDGPIFTQNLVTQRVGRALYDDMVRRTDRMYIGVIKDLSGSWATCRWSASALNPGEGYIVCPISAPIEDRYNVIAPWLNSPPILEYVRVVYRPAQKAFAFECKRRLVGLACAILTEDASKTINHELPTLLETVDAQLRAGFDAGAARDFVVSRIMAQADGYYSAIDATSERDFR
jgi:hypothetical protein